MGKFKSYKGYNFQNILFCMTSGDLNIDLTQKSYSRNLQFFHRTIKRRLPFVAPIRGFRDLKGAEKASRPIPNLSEPARNRVKTRMASCTYTDPPSPTSPLTRLLACVASRGNAISLSRSFCGLSSDLL